MSVTQNRDDQEKAIQDLILFVGEFVRLIDQQVSDVRTTMLKTVDQMMASVMQINEAADRKLKMAGEILVKDVDQSKFVSKRAKDLDERLIDPAERVKVINEQISSHMTQLSNLDDSVRMVLFSIMGALSMDDVVRQRIEHVTTAAHAVDKSIKSVMQEYLQSGLKEDRVKPLINKMALDLFKSYTMEEEKAVFKAVLGDVKNYQSA
jgi:hypothetical protein